MFLAQSALDASSLFYLTLLVIFLTAIITTLATKWSRDKCLKFFAPYRITLERARGQTLWGRLQVFSSGIEVLYDHPYIDPHGQAKTSYLFYQADLDQQVLSLFRYHNDLPPDLQQRRLRQIQSTFNPRFFRRTWRGLRNIVNTLRDAFAAAFGAFLTQFQRLNPAAGAILTTQPAAVTNLGQTLIGRFANAYEPLLEQYIGLPVILEVLDPINPNNVIREYPGYLADYTQQFIAVFNAEHPVREHFSLTLPDIPQGDPLPPLPAPPPPGAPAPTLPPPLATEHGLAIRIDGARLKIQNTRREVLAIRTLDKPGYEPFPLNMLLPPMATLSLPARDARGGALHCDVLAAIDVLAPRRYATIRHAGQLLDRPTLTNHLSLTRLPLVSRLFPDSEKEDT